MEAFERVVSGLYLSFVVRDFIAKVIPGFIVALAVYQLSQAHGLDLGVAGVPELFAGAAILGGAWLAGIAVQNAGEIVFGNLSRGLDETETALVMKGLAAATPQEQIKHERCIVLKEAAHNGAMAALLWAAANLAGALAAGSFMPPMLVCVALATAAAMLLLRQRRLSRKSQSLYEDVFAERARSMSSQTTGSSPV